MACHGEPVCHQLERRAEATHRLSGRLRLSPTDEQRQATADGTSQLHLACRPLYRYTQLQETRKDHHRSTYPREQAHPGSARHPQGGAAMGEDHRRQGDADVAHPASQLRPQQEVSHPALLRGRTAESRIAVLELSLELHDHGLARLHRRGPQPPGPAWFRTGMAPATGPASACSTISLPSTTQPPCPL